MQRSSLFPLIRIGIVSVQKIGELVDCRPDLVKVASSDELF